jgi:hypothetical protein
MSNDFQKEAVKKMAALEHWMAPLFEKAPHIPHGGRETLVKIAPWLALIAGILGLYGLFMVGALGSLLSFSFPGSGLYQASMVVSLVAGLLAAVLNLLAFSPLQKKQKKGWNFLFYGMVITIIAALLNAFVGYGSGLLGTLIGALIGFWLMFEVRSYYH